MPSRHTYTALTPEYTDFLPHSNATPLEEPLSRSGVTGGFKVSSRWQSGLSKAKRVIDNNAGLLLIAASQAFFSMVNVAVKKLNTIDPPVPTLELIAVRMGITYICSMLYMLLAGVPDPFLGPKGVRLLLVFRGFTGFFGLFGIYYSLVYLSLSDATVLTFLVPLCTAIAGSLVLGENFTRKEALAGIFSLVGVVLIARPTFIFGDSSLNIPEPDSVVDGIILEIGNSEKGTPAQRLVAVCVALVGVLGGTGAYISIRAIGKRAHPLHALTSFSIQCILVSVIGMLVTRTPLVIPTRWEWAGLLLIIGIFGFIAQVVLTLGFQRESAGRGSTGVYTQIIFATILERIFFKTTPSILSAFGTLIILTSAIYVAVTKKTECPGGRDGLDNGEYSLEEGLLDGAREDDVRKVYPAKRPIVEVDTELQALEPQYPISPTPPALPFAFRCPKPHCRKSYRQVSELKYHMEHGRCEDQRAGREEEILGSPGIDDSASGSGSSVRSNISAEDIHESTDHNAAVVGSEVGRLASS